ncbi:unnamed protein product [Adineta steineri]|uniref:Uncharacterized protein n=1 Tax=Adineta steineri TaxID=433720 RepID=A0A818UUS1_9BILA|nr:unnamed protein product [Adineta steineri]CAF3933492.1 unnamed protein product [Adineta steineri]
MAETNGKWIYIIFGLLTLFTITTVVLSAVILGVVVNRLDSKNETSLNNNGPVSFADQIKIDELMKHLQQLQIIADRSNGTRVIATAGFNDTLDYIVSQLEQNTNLIVKRQYFTVRNFIIQGTPRLQTLINGNTTDRVYITEFAHILFSQRADFDSHVRVVVIPNQGCNDADWSSVSAADSVALVIRGVCTYPEKSALAEKYRVKGLLIYNDGTTLANYPPVQGVRNNLNTTIPAFFISYTLGMQLVNGAADASVMMNIDVSDANGIGNICADTPTGDKTKTIVVGSHSDGVAAGSGINDNGSGTIGNLILALNLARLFQTSSASYSTYPYRVRFCWWGAEEHGLLGARYHVEQALLPSTIEIGERFQDYLLNLNYDMLAGPNYRFGIHDDKTVLPTTPTQALYGTSQITNIFRQWFNEQNLPWSNSSLGGGSDYIPFLAAGLAVGGVNTGAGGSKPASERDQYAAVLGIGNGGIANAAYDPCYHQQCDRINNINPFAYEKVVKAAAYAIEYFGRLNDLEKWLYPQGRMKNYENFNRDRIYDFGNDPDLI